MTAAEQLLRSLTARGVRLQRTPTGLRIVDGQLYDQELEDLKRHRDEVIALLPAPSPPPP